jgi:hypothetical protein
MSNTVNIFISIDKQSNNFNKLCNIVNERLKDIWKRDLTISEKFNVIDITGKWNTAEQVYNCLSDISKDIPDEIVRFNYDDYMAGLSGEVQYLNGEKIVDKTNSRA